jgi:hypothetical protein
MELQPHHPSEQSFSKYHFDWSNFNSPQTFYIFQQLIIGWICRTILTPVHPHRLFHSRATAYTFYYLIPASLPLNMGYIDSDDRKSVCHTQTEKKHQILRMYLNAWYPILGSWNERLVVVDGFAGQGEYYPWDGDASIGSDSVEGSPLITLNGLLEHDKFLQGGGKLGTAKTSYSFY